MPQLDFDQPPFDLLTASERQSLKKHSQIRYLESNESLTADDSKYLFVVMKGHLNHTQKIDNTDKFIGDFDKNDWFVPQDNHQYQANMQTLLLQIENSAIEKISAQNQHIRQLLNGELSEKMQALQQQPSNNKHNRQQQGEAQQLMLQPVTAIKLLPVHTIEQTSSILT
ncbi:MAG: nucleotidyltransferase, partial [Moraxellaceae bacterium]|nr:nucleotidyltransferase [Moraxellaceae bacterium]